MTKLLEKIRNEGNVFISRDLRGAHAFWKLTIRYEGFTGECEMSAEMTGKDVGTMVTVAAEKVHSAIYASARKTSELMKEDSTSTPQAAVSEGVHILLTFKEAEEFLMGFSFTNRAGVSERIYDMCSSAICALYEKERAQK